uniref:Eap30 subunit of ell complex, putative n=1 Tax=Theileria annulata TaxID=5874 RepID=A0A3B0MYW0_THEAN
MKKGMDFSDIIDKNKRDEKLRLLSSQVSSENRERYLAILNDFRTNFENFVKRHHYKINSDPDFRVKFLEMCDILSIDVLELSPRIRPNFSRVLGTVNSFLPEICTLMLEICINTRNENGGICELSYLLEMFPKSYKLTQNDLLKASKEFRVFGDSIKVVQVNDKYFVVTNPDLSNVHCECLKVATELKRGISCLDLSTHLGWTIERSKIVLNQLTAIQITWIDINTNSGIVNITLQIIVTDNSPENPYYWFTSLINTF